MLTQNINDEPLWDEVRARLKTMVLNTLTSENSRRAYSDALEQFFAWLKDNNGKLDREGVLAFRSALIEKKLADSTINQRLAAVKAFAREAEVDGRISTDCGRHIEKVKGIPVRARREGNWMTRDQVKECFGEVEIETLRGKRDLVILALLFGCGLRRTELSDLGVSEFEKRGKRWCIPNLRGKGRRPRLVTVPDKTMLAVRQWTTAADIADGRLIRAINKADQMWGDGVDPSTIWDIIAQYAGKIGIEEFAPHDARRTYARLLRKQGKKIEEIQRALGHSSPMTTHRYIGPDDDEDDAINDGLDLF